MKKWLKRASLVVVGAGMLASCAFTAPITYAKSLIKQDLSKDSPQSSNQGLVLKSSTVAGSSAVSSDTIVVKFTKPLTQTEHRGAGGTLVKQFSDLHYAVVQVKDQSKRAAILANYQHNQKVVSIMPSALYQPFALIDPKAAKQVQNDLLHLVSAQGLAGKHKVIVAVIDTGIDSLHPDLKGRLLPSYNAVNPMNQGLADSHGTHVAGIIAANKGNGIGGFGVNPNAYILPIDVFNRKGSASDYSIADGILYAINHGARVINMSLGGSMPSPLIQEAIKKALSKNVTVVAASGNLGDETPQYPAAYEGVISVGSINSGKGLSGYSTYGTSLDLVAPGEKIYSTIYEYEKKSSFREMSGTSMAAPMVTGAVSLLLSKHPELTPTQVEYILEHTAADLGPKGYDIYYGNGLIDPLAALKFDIKKLPALIHHPLSEKEIIQTALPVTISGKSVLKGAITKPFQEKWYKTDALEGEQLQFVLDGDSQHDYKLKIRMAASEDVIEVNNAREGKKEGKLFTVPDSGTVLFCVMDVNGRYDDTKNALASYTLAVQKMSALPEDESTYDKPVPIELPYKSETNRLIGEDGDDDFYTFSVKDQQAIKISLSAIAGVDANISVYTAEQLAPPSEDPTGEEQASNNSGNGDDPPMEEPAFDPSNIEPLFYTNNGSYSDGETLTFIAAPATQYVIMVSNKIFNSDGFNSDFDFKNSGKMNADQSPESSLDPYRLAVEGKVLPADEDLFPAGGGKGVGASDTYVNAVIDSALDYKIGGMATGYLQSVDDEDWFAVTPAETGIYQFSIGNAGPAMTVYRIGTQQDAEGEDVPFLDQVGTNGSSAFSNQLSPSFYTGLKKGEIYYLKVSSSFFTNMISFEPYKLTVKLTIRNPQDAYEDNDSLDKITHLLPKGTIEGNFAMPNDVDAFYLQEKTSQIYGVLFNRKPLNYLWQRMYPSEVINSFIGTITVVEDTNQNHRLDTDEYDNMQVIDNTTFAGTTYGSFKTEKNKNYIVLVTGQIDSPVPLSIWPYQLNISPVNLQDEDKGTIVKNNVPSKPLALKAAGKKGFQASGSLNPGVANGDEDWYVLKLSKDTKGKMELAAGGEIDGTISLYHNGKLLTKADYYPDGDSEVLYFSLKKGTYYIKLRDCNGNSTLTPYKFTVNFQ